MHLWQVRDEKPTSMSDTLRAAAVRFLAVTLKCPAVRIGTTSDDDVSACEQSSPSHPGSQVHIKSRQVPCPEHPLKQISSAWVVVSTTTSHHRIWCSD